MMSLAFKVVASATLLLANLANAEVYNIAVIYRMDDSKGVKSDSSCEDYSDRLHRVTTLSLLDAGLDLGEDESHWDQYRVDHGELMKQENVADKAARKPDKQEKDRRRLGCSSWEARMCWSGAKVYCDHCSCCGNRRRRNLRTVTIRTVKDVKKTDYDTIKLEGIAATAAERAVYHLNQWEYCAPCLKHKPDFEVTVRIQDADWGAEGEAPIHEANIKGAGDHEHTCIEAKNEEVFLEAIAAEEAEEATTDETEIFESCPTEMPIASTVCDFTGNVEGKCFYDVETCCDGTEQPNIIMECSDGITRAWFTNACADVICTSEAAASEETATEETAAEETTEEAATEEAATEEAATEEQAASEETTEEATTEAEAASEETTEEVTEETTEEAATTEATTEEAATEETTNEASP